MRARARIYSRGEGCCSSLIEAQVVDLLLLGGVVVVDGLRVGTQGLEALRLPHLGVDLPEGTTRTEHEC